jgi:branched-chain amino acid transport system ATP-binding protein
VFLSAPCYAMQEDTKPILHLENVSRLFGALRAVDGVNLDVRPGERRAIIGPNGAGKTTLFNVLSGELAASEGRILFAGRDLTGVSAHRRAAAGLGRTYQITNLFPRLTVEENLLLAVRGLSARKFSLFGAGRPLAAEADAVERALAESGMADRRRTPARLLSYGEQRELELAVALATNPRLLLLDEPAAGLSPAERVTIAERIRALPAGMTVVLIEHDMGLALGLAEYVTCLYFGQVLVEGRPDEIRSNAKVQEVYLGTTHRHA